MASVLTAHSSFLAGRPCRSRSVSLRTRSRPLTALKARAAAGVKDMSDKYGITEHVEFKDGQGGLPTVVLKHSCGSKAEVALFGACITSWCQANGSEVLYVRPDAVFDKSKPISGGVPLCFPQFGPGEMQQHGFARNLDWEVASSSADPQPDERDPEVELMLKDNDYTRGMWPFKFEVSYSISLHGEALRTVFRVKNLDEKPFTFTGALHTYFEVLGINAAKVRGLKGLSYLDKAKDPNNPSVSKDDREVITFDGSLVDSVYVGAPEYMELEVGTGASVAINSSGWSDAVVWNPGPTMKACFDKFVCVENAKCGSAVKLAPGETWVGKTEFLVVDTQQ